MATLERFFARIKLKVNVLVERKFITLSTGRPNGFSKPVTWVSMTNRNLKKTQGLRSSFDRGFLLSGRSFQRTFQRGFRAKGDKTEIKVEKVRESKWRPAASNGSRFLSFVLKTGAYTVGFSALVFGGSALWHQDNVRRHHEEFWNRGLRKQPAKKKGEMRGSFNDVWNHLSMVHKVTWGIIGANLLVLACWKFASPNPMQAWFTLKQFPLKSSVSSMGQHLATMLLSMFSHKGFVHFYINMYVLSSFAAAWNHIAQRGNSNFNGHEQYLAFYLSAGMCSSFLSSLLKIIGSIPQPSLGASGAILGLIGYTCEKMPNNTLSIVFIPSWTFSANSAKNFILAFDTAGLIIGAMTGWRYMFLDHAGHLGGMLFGMWYARHGEKLMDKYCQYITEQWGRK